MFRIEFLAQFVCMLGWMESNNIFAVSWMKLKRKAFMRKCFSRKWSSNGYVKVGAFQFSKRIPHRVFKISRPLRGGEIKFPFYVPTTGRPWINIKFRRGKPVTAWAAAMCSQLLKVLLNYSLTITANCSLFYSNCSSNQMLLLAAVEVQFTVGKFRETSEKISCSMKIMRCINKVRSI